MQCKILESRWWHNYLISKRRQKIKKGKFCLHLPLGDYSKGKIQDVLVYYAKKRRVFEPHFIRLFIERQSIKNNGMKFVRYSYPISRWLMLMTNPSQYLFFEWTSSCYEENSLMIQKIFSFRFIKIQVEEE